MYSIIIQGRQKIHAKSDIILRNPRIILSKSFNCSISLQVFGSILTLVNLVNIVYIQYVIINFSKLIFFRIVKCTAEILLRVNLLLKVYY